MPRAGTPTASSGREQIAPRPLQICAVLTAGFLASLLLPRTSFFDSPADYAGLHAALEFLAMSVGVMVFALAWNLRRMATPAWVLLVGLTSLAIVLVDMFHTLSFAGMPDLVTPSGTEKAINFWLVGRGLAAVTLVVVALLPNQRVSRASWYRGLATVLIVSGAVGWLGMHHPQWWPDTYIEGQGLTRLKISIELVLCATYVVAAVMLFRRARRESSRELVWLAAAAWAMALAELYFTMYAQVTDTANLLGHVYKAIAYLMVYRAIFVVGVQSPYLSLMREKALLGSLIDSMPDLISITDREGTLLGANRAFAERVGAPVAELLGQPAPGLGPGEPPAPAGSAPGRSESWRADKGGERRLYDTIDTPFVDPEGAVVGTIAVSRDVTELGLARMEIQHLARFDQLTGLPHRNRLLALLDSQLANAAATGRPLALLHLDLGEFRAINETLGHSVGDEVLLAVAARLMEVAASFAGAGADPPIVARLVGDEFAVVSSISEVGDAVLLARAMVAAATDPLPIQAYQLNVTASVGIALYPEHSTKTDGLLLCAEAAARQAKADGHNSVAVFTESMMAAAIQRNALVAELRVALEQEQFELHYQPQFSLEDDTLTGVEALVRWRHPQAGLQAPGRFIEVAEDSGLIVPIGDWVLRTAARQLAAWHRDGLAVPYVAVNLSPVQFLQSGLTTRVSAILAESGLAPGQLELEVTEGLAMSSADPVVERLTSLHDIGASIAIDDFGTGYSSMAYLKRFPVDRIKIDRSFVRGLGHDPRDEAITDAILHIARALGYDTIAEGVETIEQRERLREMGCNAIQGYLECRPLPVREVTEVLRAKLLQLASRDNVAQLP